MHVFKQGILPSEVLSRGYCIPRILPQVHKLVYSVYYQYILLSQYTAYTSIDTQASIRTVYTTSTYFQASIRTVYTTSRNFQASTPHILCIDTQASIQCILPVHTLHTVHAFKLVYHVHFHLRTVYTTRTYLQASIQRISVYTPLDTQTSIQYSVYYQYIFQASIQRFSMYTSIDTQATIQCILFFRILSNYYSVFLCLLLYTVYTSSLHPIKRIILNYCLSLEIFYF